MASQIEIIFPKCGELVNPIPGPRVFIAQGMVTMKPGASATGICGHLVEVGTEHVKATGKLISWQSTGLDNVFYWSLLFELGKLGDTDCKDGFYDFIASIVTSSHSDSDKVTVYSPVRSKKVIVKTIIFVIDVTYPQTGTGNINGKFFMPYGPFSNNAPNRVLLTNEVSGATTPSGMIVSGSNYWYATFPRISSGTYTLDAFSTVDGSSASTQHLVFV